MGTPSLTLPQTSLTAAPHPRSKHSEPPLRGTGFSLCLCIHLWDSFLSICPLHQHGLSLEPSTVDRRRERKGSEDEAGCTPQEECGGRSRRASWGWWHNPGAWRTSKSKARMWGGRAGTGTRGGGHLRASASWKEPWAVWPSANQSLPSPGPPFPHL